MLTEPGGVGQGGASVDRHADAHQQDQASRAGQQQKDGPPGQDASRRAACRHAGLLGVAFLALSPALVAGPGSARAEPPTPARLHRAADDPGAYLIDGRYQRGEKRLARMRAAGDLPDTIKDGRCRFELAGDPGVAYYVRTCP